jgi:phospho-N-acetylmuramoyl-pentapeptide-transferase
MNPTLQAVTIDVSALRNVFLFTSISFGLGLLLAPILIRFLLNNKVGKRLRDHGIDGKATPLFAKLHSSKAGTPTMGGLLFWVSTVLATLFFNLNRGQTYLPVFTLAAAGVIGAVDDLLNVRGKGSNGGGLRFLYRFPIFLGVAIVAAWWFYVKLGFSDVYLPFDLPWFGISSGNHQIGWWYVPLMICVLVFTSFSVNETDGLDGLAGGVGAFASFVFTVIALTRGQESLAIFCATLTGSLLAFLWFNVHPARFFMGDTGSMALGMVLPILAFLTNSVIVLPLILIIPYIEGISAVIQIISKKLFKRKVFLIAPIHHHFEALGWPEVKVTMRFLIISIIGGALGLLVMLTNR